MTTWNESVLWVGKQTPKRLHNAFQIWRSYQQSRASLIPIVKGLPVSIGIEPTTSCNLRCPECPSGLRSFTRHTGMLDPELFRNAIDQLHRHIFYMTFYFQGEPLLHPRFCEMVKYASDKNIYTATSTNAHF